MLAGINQPVVNPSAVHPQQQRSHFDILSFGTDEYMDHGCGRADNRVQLGAADRETAGQLRAVKQLYRVEQEGGDMARRYEGCSAALSGEPLWKAGWPSAVLTPKPTRLHHHRGVLATGCGSASST